MNSSLNQDLITAYVHAKDHNQPHRLRQVFAADARLEMVVNGGSISFPPRTRGADAIADVLARRFGQSFENVHTFCVTDPPGSDTLHYSCRWLVGMSEKDNRAVRVGCGRYDWSFEPGTPHRVRQLGITVDQMHQLPPDKLAPVMAWLDALPYPWCPMPALTAGAPAIEALRPLIDYFV